MRVCGGMTSAGWSCVRKSGHKGRCGGGEMDFLETLEIVTHPGSWEVRGPDLEGVLSQAIQEKVYAIFYDKQLLEDFKLKCLDMWPGGS